MSPTGSPQTI
ncbi:hypothetical protein LINGRAHAP2_LOCUS17120 [Linum grandiflorum]